MRGWEIQVDKEVRKRKREQRRRSKERRVEGEGKEGGTASGRRIKTTG